MTTTEYRKPLPSSQPHTRPFWQAAKQNELKIQRCKACGHVQHYPRAVCTACWSVELDWQACTGKGSVYSYTVAHRSTTPGFQDDDPYLVAIVELEEGVRMTTNIVDCPPKAIHVGMAVQVVFDHVSDDVALVKFRPA
jgi:uncharacterized OB-fold protein